MKRLIQDRIKELEVIKARYLQAQENTNNKNLYAKYWNKIYEVDDLIALNQSILNYPYRKILLQ